MYEADTYAMSFRHSSRQQVRELSWNMEAREQVINMKLS